MGRRRRRSAALPLFGEQRNGVGEYRGRVDAIALADGRLVELGQATVGGSKNDTRFGRIGRQRVVVKIQREHGRLMDEEQALQFLAEHGVRVAQVVGSGVTPDGHRFLVISREAGVRTVTPEGWARFGRDVAALLEVPVATCPFPRTSTAQFAADHRDRLELVRSLLKQKLAEEISDAIAQVAAVDRLVVTHGDPGSGNYLDNENGEGILLDWETASVSPFGLDLGRAVFIGLLDLGGSGIPDELVSAFIRGYTERSPLAAQMTGQRIRAWIIVGGLQFIHGRHTQPLLPERTAQVAANVLESYLTRAR